MAKIAFEATVFAQRMYSPPLTPFQELMIENDGFIQDNFWVDEQFEPTTRGEDGRTRPKAQIACRMCGFNTAHIPLAVCLSTGRPTQVL